MEIILNSYKLDEIPNISNKSIIQIKKCGLVTGSERARLLLNPFWEDKLGKYLME